jgi:hypothetical protein
MDFNPYESPRDVSEPVEPSPDDSWWLESLSLFAVVLLATIVTPLIFSYYLGWF